MAKKYCYLFTEGNAKMREILGGKGANLAEMTGLGMPVPRGFTITTEACTQYYEDGRKINDEIQAQIMEHIDKMEGFLNKNPGLRSRIAFHIPFEGQYTHFTHQKYRKY